MALQDITTKILDDARAQAQSIARAADVEVKRLMASADKTKKAQERQSDQETERMIAQRERTALSRARREAQQIISAARREMIDDVLTQARTAIVQADDTQYTQFLTRLLATVPTEAYAQIVEVRVPVSRRGVTEAVIVAQGLHAPITEDAQIDAGIVLVGADVDYDLTLGRALADRTHEFEASITQMLFGTK